MTGGVLIVGATSAIAEATARLLAGRGNALYLVGRKKDRVRAIAEDLKIRGASRVECEYLDVNSLQLHEAMLARAIAFLGSISVVLIAHGTLSNQTACQESVRLTLSELTTNAMSVVSLTTLLANYFEHQRAGSLIVISSVAGDRGRQSNYVYGSAKALVTTYVSGIRQRLHKQGIAVITIKPGYVDTPMTAAIPKGRLWAKPDTIAKGILRALDRRRDVVYLPFFWRPIMAVIKVIPERIFRTLSL